MSTTDGTPALDVQRDARGQLASIVPTPALAVQAERKVQALESIARSVGLLEAIEIARLERECAVERAAESARIKREQQAESQRAWNDGARTVVAELGKRMLPGLQLGRVSVTKIAGSEWSVRAYASDGRQLCLGTDGRLVPEAMPADDVRTDAVSKSLPIIKVDAPKRLAFGWASVSNHNGHNVVDLQGDSIPLDELERAVQAFMAKGGTLKSMHQGETVGRIVESLVTTPEKLQTLGLAPDSLPLGWLVGVKVESDEVWGQVERGELKAFSIGGRARRVEV